jgi:hypothetical protein
LRQFGSQPERDCAQLWRRIGFNILIANTDDTFATTASCLTAKEGGTYRQPTT